MTVRILVGDCRDTLQRIAADSVDSTVTDPPYGLTANKKGGSGQASVNLDSPAGRSRIGTGNGGGFMGMPWDSAVPPVEVWLEVFRVMKPGAYLLAFGGTRTFHRQTCAIEDAGFEIQDCLAWIFGSGFPKHQSKLKPAYEPIVLARKPAPKATPLNIDACRIATTDPVDPVFGGQKGGGGVYGDSDKYLSVPSPLGRWPANVVLDEQAAAMLDVQAPAVGGAAPASGPTYEGPSERGSMAGAFNGMGDRVAKFHGDIGGASRFFYCAKASRDEREIGLEDAPRKMIQWSSGPESPGTFQSEGTDKTSSNHHPTVKPVDLMRWLCRLVTPRGGVILDPFFGSGTTAIAATAEGFSTIGCELNPEYAAIAERRITGDNPLFAGVSME